jgi:predicted dehydrogenase
MTSKSTTRREFVETMGRLGLAAAGSLATVESARGFAANDTIRVACLGTGGRCRTLMHSLAKVPGVRIVAVSDIYDVHLAEGKKLADSQAVATKHYRELLDRKDIDAVLIGSPDHWHVPMTVDACNAGKDVYVEKPLTHDRSEGATVIDAQNRNARIVQVGMQQRSMPHIRKARERLKAGAIGRVIKVHMTWNRGGRGQFRKTALGIDPNQVAWHDFLGKAADRPFDEYQFRNWRWFWDFGGGLLTDLMVHWIDVAHWLLDLDHPLEATTIGNHIAGEGVWETPDTIQCLLEYPGPVQMHFEGTFSNARLGAMISFEGTDGTLYIDRGRYEITSERGNDPPETMILGSNPKKGQDFYDKPDGELLHLSNWVECIRSRKPPHAPVEAGVAAAGAAQLGNEAYRGNRVAEWKSA